MVVVHATLGTTVVYDHTGEPLAIGVPGEGPPWKRLLRQTGIDFWTMAAEFVVRVEASSQHDHFRAIADGASVGEVRGNRIVSAGLELGRLKRRWSWRRLLGEPRRYQVLDTQGNPVGRVTRTLSSGLGSCNVIEFEKSVSPKIHALAMAIDEAISYKLAPKSGGGSGG